LDDLIAKAAHTSTAMAANCDDQEKKNCHARLPKHIDACTVTKKGRKTDTGGRPEKEKRKFEPSETTL